MLRQKKTKSPFLSNTLIKSILLEINMINTEMNILFYSNYER